MDAKESLKQTRRKQSGARKAQSQRRQKTKVSKGSKVKAGSGGLANMESKLETYEAGNES